MADPGRTIPSFFIDSILRRDAPSRSAPLPAALSVGDDDENSSSSAGSPRTGPPDLPLDAGRHHHHQHHQQNGACVPPDPAPPPHRQNAGRAAQTAPHYHQAPTDAAPMGNHAANDSYNHTIAIVQTGTNAVVDGFSVDGDVVDACHHDNVCPHYGMSRGSAGHVGNYGEGVGPDGLRCHGNDRRDEGMLDEGSSILNRDEPKQPEVVGDLGDDGKKRPRTAFSADQVRSLEQEFQRSKYLSVSKRTEMSRQLGLTEQQIKIWFQNRRTKWKRKYTNNLEILAQQHYLRMGLLPAYPFHPPGGATKPGVGAGFVGGVFGGPALGGRPPFPGPQSAVRLYPPFAAGPTLPRM